MSNGTYREMTLEECMKELTTNHRARKEYKALVKSREEHYKKNRMLWWVLAVYIILSVIYNWI